MVNDGDALVEDHITYRILHNMAMSTLVFLHDMLLGLLLVLIQITTALQWLARYN